MMLPVQSLKARQPVGMVTTGTPWFGIGEPAPSVLWLASWSGASYQAAPPPFIYAPSLWTPEHTHLMQWDQPAVELLPVLPLFYHSSHLCPLPELAEMWISPEDVTVFQRREKAYFPANHGVPRPGGHTPQTCLLWCPTRMAGHMTTDIQRTRESQPKISSPSSPPRHRRSTPPLVLSAGPSGAAKWDRGAWPIVVTNQRLRGAGLKPPAMHRLCSPARVGEGPTDAVSLSCLPVQNVRSHLREAGSEQESIGSLLDLDLLLVGRRQDLPALVPSPFSSGFTFLKRRGLSAGQISWLLRTRSADKNHQCVSSDKPEGEGEKARKDKRPVASTPVPGSPWCVVWTADDRVFFFNPTMHLSVWEKPGDLIGRDISHIIGDPPHKRKKITPDCHSSGLHGNSEGSEHRRRLKRTRIDESDVPLADMKLLPLERRISDFTEMMLERGVSAFSSWEKELHKMVFDPRYLLLTSIQRKQVYDRFVKSRMKDELKEKKNKLLRARDGFKQLLEEARLSSRTSFKEFCVRYHGDWRFTALSGKKDQQVLFNHHVTSLRRRDGRAKLRKFR